MRVKSTTGPIPGALKEVKTTRPHLSHQRMPKIRSAMFLRRGLLQERRLPTLGESATEEGTEFNSEAYHPDYLKPTGIQQNLISLPSFRTKEIQRPWITTHHHHNLFLAVNIDTQAPSYERFSKQTQPDQPHAHD